MLTKLTIKNFLRNKKLSILFDKHITTIVGKSAAGKSSSIRALKWLMTNTPSGDRFINWDADEAKVILRADDHKFVRTRGKQNLYKLDKEKFISFKNNVPDEIKKILNVSDVNFQSQHANHFWFSLSPPEVGRQLNKIVNLDSIDTALANILSKNRAVKWQMTLHEDKIRALKETIKEDAYIVTLNKQLTDITKKQKAIDEKTASSMALGTLLSKYSSNHNLKIRAASRATDTTRVISRLGVLIKLENRVEELSNLIQTAENAHAMTQTEVPDISHITEQLINQSILAKKIKKLRKYLDEVKTWRNLKSNANVTKRSHEKELNLILKKACPICGKPKVS